jgi:hypothetical protein
MAHEARYSKMEGKMSCLKHVRICMYSKVHGHSIVFEIQTSFIFSYSYPAWSMHRYYRLRARDRKPQINRVCASYAFPVYIWQLKSDLHAAFAFILAPETLAL